MNIRTLGSLILLPLLAGAAPAVRQEMLVSTDWLAQHLNDPKVVVLHIGASADGYNGGHIPGARLIQQSQLVVTRNGVTNELPPAADLKALLEKAGVSDDTRIILYPEGTSPLFAARAYFTLDYLGHGDHTSMLDGGLAKWKAESRAMSKDAPTVAEGHFTPRVRPEVVVGIDAVKDMSWTLAGQSAAKQSTSSAALLSSILLDARPAADYHGTNGGADPARVGHIPGAVNVTWSDATVAGSSVLKPENELRKIYESAGIKADMPVVTYCGSGIQASEAYFTLKYLGYDVKLYDGSFSQWSSDKETAIQK